MTDTQSALFKKLVDLNWEIDQLFKQGKAAEAFKLTNEFLKTKQALIEDMGREEYDRFIEMGRQMLAPVE